MTQPAPNEEKTNRNRITLLVALVGCALIATSFALETPGGLLQGEWAIITSPGILITDFIAVGGLGAAFFNAGLNTLIGLGIAWLLGSRFNGPLLSAIFIVTGFSFFGKTPFNILPICLGVYLHDRFLAPKRSGNLIMVMLYATTLGPIVSQAAFGFGWGAVGLPTGIALGVLAGGLISALGGHVSTFHKGYNLYNTGTTAGFVGTGIYMLMRAFGLQIDPVFYWSTEHTDFLAFYMLILLLLFIVVGFIWGAKLDSYRAILTSSGRAGTDFTEVAGLGSTLVNMGLVGLIGLGYIALIGGDINGAILAALFTMLGFGAVGKQPVNIIPVMAGVCLMCYLSKWTHGEPGPMLAATFGTALAPFSGRFGPLAGLIAGMLHLPMLMHVGALHGYMNLYNNGFAAGLVMLLAIGVIQGVKPEWLAEGWQRRRIIKRGKE
jgi:hypothetical protein